MPANPEILDLATTLDLDQKNVGDAQTIKASKDQAVADAQTAAANAGHDVDAAKAKYAADKAAIKAKIDALYPDL